ncbi:MAG: 7-carboxy-7-deazaguanine synthase QueE, partial [Bacteroidales bacterium]|nr:7-carboxy-7-deazaguanine synthase QueE [Bacteroidales bacterium]
SKESWNPDRFPPVEIEEIVRQAAATPAKAIVITGGEPMNYPLDRLCNLLKDYGLDIFLETSGSSPMSGKFDWICLSPKRNKPPREEFFPLADELKVIVETPEDFEWAEENRRKVLEAQRCGNPSPRKCMFFLQPEWSRMKQIAPAIVEYVKAHPEWNISVQTHKFLRIP